jgi:nitrogen fixation protein NifQ
MVVQDEICLAEVSRAAAADLLAVARQPGHPDSIFFARAVAHCVALGNVGRSGLTRDELNDLLRQFFPGAAGLLRPPHAAPKPPADNVVWPVLAKQLADYRLDAPAPQARTFTREVSVLLRAHCVSGSDASCWVIRLIARACLRPDHLWRDLGLSGRDEVSALLQRYFPALVARNTLDLRWKKFLAHAVCEQTGAEPAPAPGCGACDEYGNCYRSPKEQAGSAGSFSARFATRA